MNFTDAIILRQIASKPKSIAIIMFETGILGETIRNRMKKLTAEGLAIASGSKPIIYSATDKAKEAIVEFEKKWGVKIEGWGIQ